MALGELLYQYLMRGSQKEQLQRERENQLLTDEQMYRQHMDDAVKQLRASNPGMPDEWYTQTAAQMGTSMLSGGASQSRIGENTRAGVGLKNGAFALQGEGDKQAAANQLQSLQRQGGRQSITESTLDNEAINRLAQSTQVDPYQIQLNKIRLQGAIGREPSEQELADYTVKNQTQEQKNLVPQQLQAAARQAAFQVSQLPVTQATQRARNIYDLYKATHQAPSETPYTAQVDPNAQTVSLGIDDMWANPMMNQKAIMDSFSGAGNNLPGQLGQGQLVNAQTGEPVQMGAGRSSVWNAGDLTGQPQRDYRQMRSSYSPTAAAKNVANNETQITPLQRPSSFSINSGTGAPITGAIPPAYTMPSMAPQETPEQARQRQLALQYLLQQNSNGNTYNNPVNSY